MTQREDKTLLERMEIAIGKIKKESKIPLLLHKCASSLHSQRDGYKTNGHCPIQTLKNQMINVTLLSDAQSEVLAGGNGGGWGFPSLTSKTSSMEINNLISQSNIGSAWASSASASTGGLGGGWHRMFSRPQEIETTADATNIQKNFNGISNFGFSFAV
jgi:hypothetical protein